MPGTPGNSGHHGSSGRSAGVTIDDVRVPSARHRSPGQGLSDRWSEDENGAPPSNGYDMTMPESEKPTTGMGSPLLHGGPGEVADLEEGAKMVSGDGGMTVAAGRGAQEFGARSSAPKDVRDHVKQVIDQNKSLVRPNVVRNLVLTYSITVFIVILLSLAGQVVVHVYIHNASDDAAVINVSGRQRMLSQLLVKGSLAMYYMAHDAGVHRSPNSTYYITELTKRFALWKVSHTALINGTDGSFPGVPKIDGSGNGAVLDMSAQQQPHYEAMEGAISTILNISGLYSLPEVTVPGQGPLEEGSLDYELLGQQIDILLANEGPFWKLQDNMTQVFQQEADDHLNFVLILSWVLHIMVIVTLILEGVFVFWPVARSLQRLIDERFDLIRRSLESEAENRGVSILMMGYISHELQQPLAGLTEHLENARDFLRSVESASAVGGVPRGDPALAAANPLTGAVLQVDKARMCCELLNTVSGDITNLRNIELGRMALVVEVVDVADVVQQVLSTLAPKVPFGVQLKVEIAPEIEQEHRRLDKHRLQQILLNLVDNAFRTTSEGEVVVRAREGRSPSVLLFEVEDTGEGLTEEQRQSLYEPVLDSSGLREGNTNLALYVVKLLAELQNGKYGMESIPGGGNKHWVELPAVSGGKVGAAAESAHKMQTVQESE